ncbi:MAG: dihydroneopterin aldolase [Betaproteobacteria bacterium]|nr:dihydroneopterin aldolase [Betaproteobacteria bacterium]
MDVIFINDLRIQTLIGVYAWERKVPQTVQLDLEIALPDRRAAQSDRLSDTIDYAAIVARIETSLRENRISLLEKLAEHIAQLIMREFRSPWVKVSVTKLAALGNVRKLGVTVERGERG